MNAQTDTVMIIAAPGETVTDAAQVLASRRSLAEAGASLLALDLAGDAGGDPPSPERALELLADKEGETDDSSDASLPVLQPSASSGRLGPQPVQDFLRVVRPTTATIDFRTLAPDEGDAALKRLRGFIRWLKVMGIAPQFVMRSPAEVARFVRLRGMDYIPLRRPFLLFVLGADAPGTEDTAGELDGFLGALDTQPVEWAVCTQGRDEAAVIFRAALEGGHVRTGTAHNRRLPDGDETDDTARLVAAAADILRQTGREPMTPQAARAFLAKVVK